VDPFIMIGPRGVPTNSGMLVNTGSGESDDRKHWTMAAGNQATPTQILASTLGDAATVGSLCHAAERPIR
jgi:hypothetical protein